MYLALSNDEFTKNFSEYHLMNLKALDEKQLNLQILVPQNKSRNVFQILQLNNNRSCFIGEHCNLKSDIILIQQCDPLFIFLHLVQSYGLCKRCIVENKSCDYSELFTTDQLELKPLIQYLKDTPSFQKQIEHFCKKITLEDSDFYKFQWDLVFNWLDKKIKQVDEKLVKEEQTFFEHSYNPQYIKTKLNQIMDLYRIFLSPEYFDKYCSSRSIDLKIPPQKLTQSQQDHSIQNSHSQKQNQQQKKKISKKDELLSQSSKNTMDLRQLFSNSQSK